MLDQRTRLVWILSYALIRDESALHAKFGGQIYDGTNLCFVTMVALNVCHITVPFLSAHFTFVCVCTGQVVGALRCVLWRRFEASSLVL